MTRAVGQRRLKAFECYDERKGSRPVEAFVTVSAKSSRSATVGLKSARAADHTGWRFSKEETPAKTSTTTAGTLGKGFRLEEAAGATAEAVEFVTVCPCCGPLLLLAS